MFFKIQTNEDVWSWITDKFVPIIVGQSWYNSEPLGLTKFVNDNDSLLLGNMNLRQNRVEKGLPKINANFFFY